ncbi:hypothetical protein VDGD_21212 [Verticillium dahliae]|nr:hypothetical protein VDGD_21212 [Verticillium dahliae]
MHPAIRKAAFKRGDLGVMSADLMALAEGIDPP